MVKPQHAGFDFATLQAHLDDMAQIYAPHALQRGRPRAQPEPAPIYQLKITLRHIKPPIWRRVQVSGHITLAKLHTLIQVVMGWTDSHLHCFEVDGISYSLPNENDDLDMQDSRGVLLTEVAPNEKDKIRYEYDFGDSWEHDIVVEEVLPPDAEFRHPVCITGRRACPPEDIGGPWGYVRFLEIMANPEDPEYEEMLEWYGDDFDADAFDRVEINRQLRVMNW